MGHACEMQFPHVSHAFKITEKRVNTQTLLPRSILHVLSCLSPVTTEYMTDYASIRTLA